MTTISMRGRVHALMLLAAAPLALAAPAFADDAFKVAIIMPGPISDNDFNAGGYNGLMAIKEQLGAEVAYSEQVPPADAERLMREYAANGFDLIFGHSFSYGDAALAVSEDFPDVKFMANSSLKQTENVGGYFNPDYQGAYLTGMLSAGASQSGVIGWVGGNPAPNMLANFHAWKAGAQDVNPEIKVMISWLGAWFDPPKAKEAAFAQVEQGADVLSAQSVGVIDAAKEKGVLVIGAMSDQSKFAPENVLTSTLWDMAPVMTAVAQTVKDGTWESKNWIYGIKEGAISLAPFNGLDAKVRPEVLEAVKARQAEIAAGTFEVPFDTSMVQ